MRNTFFHRRRALHGACALLLACGLTARIHAADLALDAGTVPQSIVAGDFTGDGHNDLAVALAFDDAIAILPGNGAGGFGTAQVFAADPTFGVGNDLPRDLAACDLNGDGVPDLAVTTSGSPSQMTNSRAGVLYGRRKGGFEPLTLLQSVGTSASLSFTLTAAALREDELPSLLVGYYGGQGAALYENKGPYDFDSPKWIPLRGLNGGPLEIAFGDFDLDGRFDLISANMRELLIARAFSHDDFGPATPFASTSGAWQSVALSDYNNDGKLDVAAVDSAVTTLHIFSGVGVNGSVLGTQLVPLPAAGAVSLVAADFNNDGREDLAVAFNIGGNVAVLLGDGQFGFSLQQAPIGTGAEPRQIAAAYLDDNLRLDWATANEGDQFAPQNPDVSVELNAPAGLDEVTSPTSQVNPSVLGAGIREVAGAAWHAGRGTLFICEPTANEIVELSASGMRLATISLAGLGLHDPSGITVEPATGDLFVADQGEQAIYRISAQGILTSSFSTLGAGCKNPGALAWSSEENVLLVGDARARKLHVFTATGTTVRSHPLDYAPLDMEWDTAGQCLWLVASGRDRLYELMFDEDDGEIELDEESSEDYKEIAPLLGELRISGVAGGPSGQWFLFGPRGLMVRADSEWEAQQATELGLGMSIAGVDSASDPAYSTWLLDAGVLGTVIKTDYAGDCQPVFTVNSLQTEDATKGTALAWQNFKICVLDPEGSILEFNATGSLLRSIPLPSGSGAHAEGLEFDHIAQQFLVLYPGRVISTDVNGAVQSALPITVARHFCDLALNPDRTQIVLYPEGGYPWMISRATGQLLRGGPTGLTQDFEAGYYCPDGSGKQMLFSANSKLPVLYHATASSSVQRWLEYE